MDIYVKYVFNLPHVKYSMFSLFHKRCWRLVWLW